MTDIGQLVHLLRNTPVRELVNALKKDGFSLQRETKTGGRIYSHPDGRMTVIHYHRGSDTLRSLRRLWRAAQRNEYHP